MAKRRRRTWSPTLKKMIALATVRREYTRPGTRLQFEITVEAVRHQVRATVVKTPFFNPKRKTATPIATNLDSCDQESLKSSMNSELKEIVEQYDPRFLSIMPRRFLLPGTPTKTSTNWN